MDLIIALVCLQMLANVCVSCYTNPSNSERTVNEMANTSAVYARIDTGLKENAEAILSRLGVTPSGAIQMLYSQIVLRQGLPFDLYLPRNDPAAIGGMSRTELDEELKKGVNSLRSDSYTADEIDAVLAEEFGL